ncbi:hypothetical protein BDW22DRAFT_1363106 [Trametopsis cervina]|nr:hypothetical protein BDW22DRAFT_1363106 [Trametopsis cervina]
MSDHAMHEADQDDYQFPATQIVVQPSYVNRAAVKAGLWGYLVSSSGSCIELHRRQREYIIGRGDPKKTGLPNFIGIEDVRVSRMHCSITWNGQEDENGALIRVTQLSRTNSTWVNHHELKPLPAENTVYEIKHGQRISFAGDEGADCVAYEFSFVAAGMDYTMTAL